jgi:hypothetical protein
MKQHAYSSVWKQCIGTIPHTFGAFISKGEFFLTTGIGNFYIKNTKYQNKAIIFMRLEYYTSPRADPRANCTITGQARSGCFGTPFKFLFESHGVLRKYNGTGLSLN